MSYTPTNWQAGDIITAAKLNNMENGIANAGDSDLFVVHLMRDENYNNVTLETAAEIYNAYVAGKTIVLNPPPMCLYFVVCEEAEPGSEIVYRLAINEMHVPEDINATVFTMARYWADVLPSEANDTPFTFDDENNVYYWDVAIGM